MLVTRLLGSEAHASMSADMLRFAARVEMFPPAVLAAGRANKVRVRVTNVGAGHKLPTGFPEGREMWLDFRVVDGNGRVLYRLGTVKDGHTEPGTASFKVVLGGKNGNVVDLDVLDADRVLYDTRIEPKGYRDIEYTFDIPAQVAGPVRLVADLNYWSFPQAFLDHLFGSDAPRTVITKMADASATVRVSATAQP